MTSTDKDGKAESGGGVAAIKTVASGGALKFGGRVVNLVLGLVAQIAMARLLLKASYGNVTITLSILTISLRFGLLGVDSGVSHLFPINEDNPSKARGVVRAAYRLSIASGLIIATSLFLFAPSLARGVFNAEGLSPLIRVVAVGLPLIIVGEISVSLARAARDVRPVVYIQNLIQPIIRVVLISGLIFVGFEATGALAGHVMAYVIASILLIIYVARILPSWDVKPQSMDRELFSYSLPLLFASGLSVFLSNMDTFMLGYFLASENVGTYNIAYQLGTFAIFFLTAGAYILPPMLARLDTKDRTREMDEVYRTITKWIAFASTPVILLLLVYPTPLIEILFSSQYIGGANVLRILVLGTFLNILTGTAGSTLTSLGNNRVVLYTIIATVVVNATLNIVLIPQFGILGAGIATATSTIVNTVLNGMILYSNYQLVPVGRFGLRTLAVSTSIAVTLYLVIGFTPLPMLIGSIIWLLIYPFIILLFGLNERDLEMLFLVEDRAGIQIPFLRRLLSYSK